jgi:hypothetical protein
MCRIHGDVDMGEHIAKQVLEVESKDIAGYVLPCNIYVVEWPVGFQSEYPTCET